MTQHAMDWAQAVERARCAGHVGMSCVRYIVIRDMAARWRSPTDEVTPNLTPFAPTARTAH